MNVFFHNIIKTNIIDAAGQIFKNLSTISLLFWLREFFNVCIIELYQTYMKKIAVIGFIVAIFLLISFFLSQRSDTAPKELSPEEIMAKQAEELNRLRQEAALNPLTEEEINRQTKELDKLRKESQANPLSQEEINKQIEELDKLRSQNNI